MLSYGHLALIASVGAREAVGSPGLNLSWAVTGLLFGGTALYLATFVYTRWTMFRLVSKTRLAAAGVVLGLLPTGHYLPALASLLELAAVVAVLNVVEHVRNAETGWRAALRRGN